MPAGHQFAAHPLGVGAQRQVVAADPLQLALDVVEVQARRTPLVGDDRGAGQVDGDGAVVPRQRFLLQRRDGGEGAAPVLGPALTDSDGGVVEPGEVGTGLDFGDVARALCDVVAGVEPPVLGGFVSAELNAPAPHRVGQVEPPGCGRQRTLAARTHPDVRDIT